MRRTDGRLVLPILRSPISLRQDYLIAGRASYSVVSRGIVLCIALLGNEESVSALDLSTPTHTSTSVNLEYLKTALKLTVDD